MIHLKFEPGCEARYMTKNSAGCDLVARLPAQIEPGQVAKVPIGATISSVDWDKVPSGYLPELQVRARSGLAYKHSIMLANGVGTVDADYPDEICVLLYNGGPKTFTVDKGMRVAQLALNLVLQIPGLAAEGVRTGGFGSTS